jgi:hypothetical protein
MEIQATKDKPKDTGDKGPFTQWVHVDYIEVTGIK